MPGNGPVSVITLDIIRMNRPERIGSMVNRVSVIDTFTVGVFRAGTVGAQVFIAVIT